MLAAKGAPTFTYTVLSCTEECKEHKEKLQAEAAAKKAKAEQSETKPQASRKPKTNTEAASTKSEPSSLTQAREWLSINRDASLRLSGFLFMLFALVLWSIENSD